MTTVTNLNTFTTRYDLSVNEARVENAQAPNPMLVTGTALNTAGGFTGGGVGNKCILGFKGHSGLALGTAPRGVLISAERPFCPRGSHDNIR